MSQNNNIKKSEGICEKIHNAVSPFRSRIRPISDKPRGSISISGDQNSPQTKPVRVRHQSKTIPVEFRHSGCRRESDDHEREVVIVRGQKFPKSAFEREEFENLIPPPHHVQFAKANSNKDEGMFSDYIGKFKNRMMKTASHGGGGGSGGGSGGGGSGGGGGGGSSMRRDSFNDKVTNYIDRARIKIRTTTNVGVEQNNK